MSDKELNGKEFKDLVKKLWRSPLNDILAFLAVTMSGAVAKWSASTDTFGRIVFWSSLVIACGVAAWLAFRVGRTLSGEAAPLEGVTAAGARGLIPFTDKDSVLFWKLGRVADVRRLLASVQNTYSAITVVHGEVGVGKTSVLWAGLKPVLKQQNIGCVYCDASVNDPLAAARTAIRNELKIDVGPNLEEVAGLQSRSVLLLDSFEQLDINRPEHGPFFTFLTALHNQSGPYSLQVIIAYRNDYRAKWFEIERRTGIRANQQPLGLLSQDDAKEALEAIVEESGIRVDRAIISGYVRTAWSSNGVSPVDIAVGAQVFESWARRLQNRHLRSSFYAKAGGSLGVLMAHVEAELKESSVPEEDLPALIRGLARGFAANQNEGHTGVCLSATELAAFTTLDVNRLSAGYLPQLASRNFRILEPVSADGTMKYRLSRDSLVPVLKQLAQDVINSDGRVELFFLEEYSRWARSRRDRDLLSGDLLSMAVENLESGKIVTVELRSYIKRSRTVNRRWLALKFASVLVASVLVARGWAFTTMRAQGVRLQSWRLPSDLYEHQGHLESLRIQGYSVTELDWLKDNNYRSLEVSGARLSSIAGLSNPRTVEDLTIDLTEAPIESLKVVARIPGLTTLTVFLGRSKVQTLADLQDATKLSTLSLYLGGSPVNSLAELSKIPITHLTLYLAGSSITDLNALKQIKTLDTLDLHLESTQLALVADLNGADSLHHLTLSIENPRNIHDIPAIRDLPTLAGMQNITDLSLKFPPPSDQAYLPAAALVSPIGNLDTLRLPPQLLRLNIDLGAFPVPGLPEISQLTSLVRLQLHLQGSGIRHLPNFARLLGLTELDLSLDAAQFESLQLAKLTNLGTLRLALTGAGISHLPALPSHIQLRNIGLDVSGTSISEFDMLSSLRNLLTLELHLTPRQLKTIPSLRDLTDLNSLSLYVVGETVNEVPALGISHDLPTLTLGFNGSSLEHLPPLIQFKNVKNLTVSVVGSKINTVDEITNISTLKSVILDVSDTQRLQQLPDFNKCGELTDVTLVLDGSSVPILPDMSGLKKLSTLSINLRNSHITDLMQFRRLLALQDLTLDQSFGSVDGLPDSLHRLTFSWRH